MKKLVFISIVLCSCAIACNEKDTLRPEGWRRTTESRFTGVQWKPCTNGSCREEKPPADGACEGQIVSRAAAVDLLLNRDTCLDKAIAALESFKGSDPVAKSDLAAAYYVRATRHDRPIDFLKSLDAADGDSPAALFNRALAQESLGFYEDSIATWEKIAKTDEKEWAGEAEQHVARLRAKEGNDAEKRWAEADAKLREALHREDRAAIAAVVGEFPFNTQRFFEGTAVPKKLANAGLLANELSHRLKDPFDLEVIGAIDRASPKERKALQEANELLGQAYDATSELTAEPAIEAFEKSARQFDRARNPFGLLADLGRATAVSFKDPDEPLVIIDRLETIAVQHRYRHLLARLHGYRSHFLFFAGRPLEALSVLNSTLAEYESLGDHEGFFRIAIAQIGIYRTIGQNDVSWRRALPLLRDAPQLADLGRRHSLYGDAAATAAALNFPRIALAYQNIPIRQFQRQLVKTTDEGAIRKVQRNIGIALRARAGIEIQLGQLAAASEDLNEAVRLLGWKPDDPITKTMLMSLDATRGESFLKQNNPAAAAEAFASALHRSETGKFHTLRARLLAQRAVALRQAGRPSEAKTDLQSAIEEIRIEESVSLASRTREAAENSWSSYFSRFQNTYRLLIEQLIEDHHPGRAFEYSEKARGQEPLNLLSSRSNAPKALAGISAAGESSLEDIQKALPAGTFLFEYCVLEEHTFVWVISHDKFDVITLPVTRDKINDWSNDIQVAANRSQTTFDAVLAAQYEHLIEAPLTMAREMNGGRPLTRLVLIPDGPMHGLPLAASRKGAAYLIEQMPIEIDGSASLYLVSLLRDRDLQSSANQTVLLVGNPPIDPTRGKFDDLPGATEEVGQLAALYGTTAISLTGSNATVPEFLRLANRSAVIHIAAHGVVDAASPSRSAILLARSPGNEGALDAETLLGELKLDRTRLVILAACTSAGGLPVGPEGVAPLVRPIIAAGAPAVIGSLWNVRDDTSAELFVSFHKHYREGSDAAIALQAAQIEMLKKYPGNTEPAMTWGAFQVIGHASSPFPPHTTQQKEKPP